MRLAPAEQKNDIIYVDRMKEIFGIDVPKVRFCFKYMLSLRWVYVPFCCISLQLTLMC